MKKLLTLFSLSLLSGYASVQAEDFKAYFNPHPDKNDVSVTIPCGFNVVFRKVYTTFGKERIKDVSFIAGTTDSLSPMSQDPNKLFVQGNFSDKNGFYFLIGKYELTEDQYRAISSDVCPVPSKQGMLPAVNVSWFEAVRSLKRLSLFLQSSKEDQIDWSQAFIRLPTDAEWEFAARGGLSVSRSEFESLLPPSVASINDYAWFQGPHSANGRLQRIGLKQPNPLGLYDMLGNAQEMMQEPFKAVRTGRLFGQSGGMCVRGGSYLTPSSSMSSASRAEKPFFKSGKEVRAKDTGLRLVLGSDVADTPNQAQRLNAAIKELGTKDSDDAQSDSVKLLEEVIAKSRQAQSRYEAEKQKLIVDKGELERKNTSLEQRGVQLEKLNDRLEKLNSQLVFGNQKLNSSLSGLKEQIVKANDERDEMRDSAIVANLRLGGFLCKSMTDELATANYFDSIAKIAYKQCQQRQDLCQRYRGLKDTALSHFKVLNGIATYYGDTMAEASRRYTLDLVTKQLSPARKAFGSTNNFENFVDVYYKHLSAYQESEKNLENNQKLWIKDCRLAVEQ